LYDHDTDPKEWSNLASDPKYEDVKNRLEKWLPRKWAQSTANKVLCLRPGKLLMDPQEKLPSPARPDNTMNRCKD
jgi:hypothetical protein